MHYQHFFQYTHGTFCVLHVFEKLIRGLLLGGGNKVDLLALNHICKDYQMEVILIVNSKKPC